MAAAAAYSNRRLRVSIVLLIFGLVVAALAGAFRIAAIGQPKFLDLYEVFICTGIIICVAVVLQLAVTTFAKPDRKPAAMLLVAAAVFVATYFLVALGYLKFMQRSINTIGPHTLDFINAGILGLRALAVALALGAIFKGPRRAGTILFITGFLVSCAGFVLRWIEVDHLPLQNLYEVFLTMGALMLPISLFCRRALRVGAEWADAVLAAVVLFPVAMVFNPDPQHLPAALQSPLFVPHVATYLAAYVVLGKAAVQAFGCLVRRPAARVGETLVGGSASRERATYAMVCFGFPLLTLGLVLGAWWGKLAWGDYWNWDPKELWSLVSWLVFLAYLHFRAVRGPRSPVLGSVLVLAGTACILITLLWANLSRLFAGLHSYA